MTSLKDPFGNHDAMPQARRNLAKVVRQSPEIFRIDDVVETLAVSRTQATSLVSRWTRQGWLRRVGPGAYAAAPIGLLDNALVLDDPWLLVPVLYSPAYVGGWSAAEYWDLTEQIFGAIVVMTMKSIRTNKQIHHGTQFVLRRIQEKRFYGLETVWRGSTKVCVSDIHRTIIDLLDTPAIGGGFQHVADCVSNYLHSEHRDDGVLINYAKHFENGAVVKRLGFLAEKESPSNELIEQCQNALTAGNAKLDPSLECPKLISKWRLWVPSVWR